MKQRGFTLIELAIVLVIITILVGGLAVPLSAQIKARRVAETRQTLEEARNAIIGYAMTHQTSSSPARPYLPCPDIDGDGLEDRTVTGGCAKNIGWFPWATLGTAAQDAWGNRLLYASHSDLTNSQTGFSSATIPAATWNQVCSSHTCATGDIAPNMPVVLVSFGPNGWGARNVNGTDQAAPTGADEQENQVGSINNIFVSRPPSNPGDAGGEFDDLAVWLSFDLINSRVCPNGGCP